MKKRSAENEYSEYDAADQYSETGRDSRGGLQIIARIVCLLLAFAIWLYVIDNDSDDYEKTFTLIAVEVEGSETLADASNMSVINLEESAVSVTVRGKRSEINALTSEDFRAYVNVGGITTADRHLVPVSVDLPAGVERINTEPSAVNIYTDVLASREVPVEVVPRYIIDSSYTIGKIEKSADTVTVSGPKNLLERIAALRAVIEMGEITTGVIATGVLEPVDKDGLAVDSKYLRLGTQDITVSLEVYTDKTVPLAAELSPGFSSSLYRGCTITPASVTLRGDPKLLAAVDKVVILNILSDEKDSYTVTLTASMLPAGISFGENPGSAEVRLILDAPEATAPPETAAIPADGNDPEEDIEIPE